jgi:histidine triad (HIT) family protein
MAKGPTGPTECLFCKIVRGEIPAPRIRESEHSLIIADIAPQAPMHFLALPKRHAENLDAFMKEREGPSELADLFSQTLLLTEEKGLAQKGYRLVINTGEEGGQTVDHLHVHLLSGRQMGWPPG